MENEICSLKFEEGPAGFPMLVAYAARDIPKKEFAGSLAAAASRSSKEFVGFNKRTLVVGEVSIRELVSRAGNSFVEGDTTNHEHGQNADGNIDQEDTSPSQV